MILKDSIERITCDQSVDGYMVGLKTECKTTEKSRNIAELVKAKYLNSGYRIIGRNTIQGQPHRGIAKDILDRMGGQ